MVLKFNEFIVEKVIEKIDIDVDYLYGFFKEDISEIEKTGIITKDMFQVQQTDSSKLQSELSIKAHSVNPVDIFINGDFNSVNNFYSPKGINTVDKGLINIGVNKEAIKYILNEANGDIEEAEKYHPGISDEFKDYRIRGSIRHELTHWYDDTFHNFYIKDILKNKKIGKHFKKRKVSNVNALPFEIYAILQNIYEAKIKFKDSWDNMTFEELINKIPTLRSIKRMMSSDTYKKWKYIIKGKMFRNNILGKNMINT